MTETGLVTIVNKQQNKGSKCRWSESRNDETPDKKYKNKKSFTKSI